jgi:hypothetical protein
VARICAADHRATRPNKWQSFRAIGLAPESGRKISGQFMQSFVNEWLFTLSAVMTLTLVGWPLTVLFRDGRRFVVLLAPMIGLITLPLLVGLIYVFAKVSFSWSALVAVGLMSLVAITVALRWKPDRDEILFSLSFILVVSALVTAISTAATIQSGVPSITFIDGSDHAGYGHVADWLTKHNILRGPIVDPDVPYESWPQLMLSMDPRLSSFILVALVAVARNLSGLFAYDSTSAIVTTVGTLGVAAVYARSRTVAIAVALALMTGVLTDLGRSGYFGKLAGYPAALVLLGLFMTSTRRDIRWIAAMILLVIGVSALHSGFATAFLLCTIGTTYLAAKASLQARGIDDRNLISRDTTFLALLIFVAIAATGLFARPIKLPPLATFPHGWDWLLGRFLELENPQADRVRSAFAWFNSLQATALGLQIAAVTVAFLARSVVALALCAWPLAVIIALYAADQKWIALQLVGLQTWCTIAGIAILSDEAWATGRKSVLVPVLAIGTMLVAIRIPRLAIAMDRYVFRTESQYRFKASQFDEIRKTVGFGIVEVDMDQPLPLIAVLNELGGRDTRLQWSPRAWTRAFVYRKWPLPHYTTQPDFRLTASGDPSSTGELVLETPQYRLWRLKR